MRVGRWYKVEDEILVKREAKKKPQQKNLPSQGISMIVGMNTDTTKNCDKCSNGVNHVIKSSINEDKWSGCGFDKYLQ